MVRPRKDGTSLKDDPPSKLLHVSVYADIALTRGDAGIHIHLKNSDFPSVEDCRQALVRLRSSFNALKAKDRRESIRFTRSPKYEGLGCFFEKTEEGWIACIRSNGLFVSTVTEANGEPVRELSPDFQRWRKLSIQATISGARSCPFSQEDIDFFWEFDPVGAEAVYISRKWELP